MSNETVVKKSFWSQKTPAELCRVDADILNVKAFPPEDPSVFSLPYIQMAKEWQGNPDRKPVSAIKIERFYDAATENLEALAKIDPGLDVQEALNGFDELWPTLSKQLREPAFYDWVEKFGSNSAFIFPYFTRLSGRAPALEMAMGGSWDVTGKFRQIPPQDTQGYYMRVAEPTFRSFVQRNWFSQQLGLMKVAMDHGWRPEYLSLPRKQRPEKVKVLFLGGGLLPQLRFYDLDLEIATEMFDIVVYDSDPDALASLEEIVGSISRYNFRYCVGDFNAARENEELESFASVISTGTLSYCADGEGERQMIGLAEAMLQAGGVYLCDNQIGEPSMGRCAMALQWRTNPPLNPKVSEDEAIRNMEANIADTTFGNLVYQRDQYNALSAIVNFCMVKS